MRFHIEFQGETADADAALLDAALDDAMDELTVRAQDPAVGGALGTGQIEISFVIEASSTERALAEAHAILWAVSTHAGFQEVRWTAARAEAVHSAAQAGG